MQKRFVRKCIYYKNERYWLICDRFKAREYHTHVPFEKKNAAIMIMKCAEKGEIKKDYPDWMIESINRLWFGKNYKSNPRLDNRNLKTNDLNVRIKKKIHRKDKYRNNRRWC